MIIDNVNDARIVLNDFLSLKVGETCSYNKYAIMSVIRLMKRSFPSDRTNLIFQKYGMSAFPFRELTMCDLLAAMRGILFGNFDDGTYNEDHIDVRSLPACLYHFSEYLLIAYKVSDMPSSLSLFLNCTTGALMHLDDESYVEPEDRTETVLEILQSFMNAYTHEVFKNIYREVSLGSHPKFGESAMVYRAICKPIVDSEEFGNMFDADSLIDRIHTMKGGEL